MAISFTRQLLVLALFVATCLGVAAAGGAITATSVQSWYPTLAKPGFTPPAWVFAPVWTVLYLLMAIAAWLVWRNAGGAAGAALTLFVIQLALNLAWSWIFFGLRRPGLAFAEILLLLAAIVATTLAFRRHSRAAVALMLPYVLWVAYASALNGAIWRLNR